MHHARASILRLILLSTPFLVGGCGLLVTHGPPAGHASLNTFACTRSVLWPMVDVALATLSAGVSVKSAATDESYDSRSTNETLVVGVLRATLWGVSAAIGFEKVSKCIVATRQLAERKARGPAGGGVGGTGVQTVVITPGADTLMVGDSIQLVAKAVDAKGGVYINKAFRWSSSNAAVASVNETGNVSAHAAGTVLIAANADNVVGTTNIVVVSAR